MLVQRLDQSPQPGQDGPVRPVTKVEYTAPQFGQTEAEAVVILACNHAYRVMVNSRVNQFRQQYPCQKCR